MGQGASVGGRCPMTEKVNYKPAVYPKQCQSDYVPKPSHTPKPVPVPQEATGIFAWFDQQLNQIEDDINEIFMGTTMASGVRPRNNDVPAPPGYLTMVIVTTNMSLQHSPNCPNNPNNFTSDDTPSPPPRYDEPPTYASVYPKLQETQNANKTSVTH